VADLPAAALGVTGVASDIGAGLRQAFDMFWASLWALVLGFGLSGAVQAFVPKEQLRRRLGAGPGGVARATVLGAASSSCSYAASAIARALVAQGADYVAAMVFLFASTNLVIDLGAVLASLAGWRFAVAETCGALIMVVLLAMAGRFVFRGQVLVGARTLAAAASHAAASHDAASHRASSHGATPDDASPHAPSPHGARRRGPNPEDANREDARPSSIAATAAANEASWRRAGSRAGWTDASAYAMGDLKMLRKELIIGFTVAGFLSALVPASAWQTLFAQGNGVWANLENAAAGPLLAVVSFVCSVGNVALAAALWKGGASFGGVISFIFADLITLPLLLIYRKQYGWRMALRMAALFWLLMSLAGLATEYLFKALRWVPSAKVHTLYMPSVGLNATTFLDVLALAVLAALYWVSRRPDPATEARYATDPVCGMQVECSSAAVTALDAAGSTVYFCSEHCRDRDGHHPGREGALPHQKWHARAMPTVYEAMGGDEGVRALAEAWHARVMQDEVVSHAFSHGYQPDHTVRLAAYWGEALGGPPTYTELYGGEPSAVRIHSGCGEHEEMDQRAIACFDQALVDAGFSHDQRLTRVLHDYFAWATTTSMARYPRSADDVPPGLSLPRWSWDGLVGEKAVPAPR